MNSATWLAYFEEHFVPEINAFSGYLSHQFTLAGKSIRIHFVSSEISTQLSLALSHRHTNNSGPDDLELYVLRRGDIAPAQPYHPRDIYFSPRSRWLFQGDCSIVHAFCVDSKKAYCLITGDQPLKHWTLSSPFRRIFDWFLALSRIHVIHGAVVGVDNTAVLITGQSGAGKSTIALHCAARGMAYLSDDYIAIDQNAIAHGLYCSLKVLNDNPFAVENCGRELQVSGEKRVLILADLPRYQLPSQIPIKAVLLPTHYHRNRHSIDLLDTKEQPSSLSPFALKQSSLIDKDTSRDLATIMSRLPTYTLSCGDCPETIPDLITRFCRSD